MCPICRKSIVDPKQIESYMDFEVANTPMPEEYKDIKINIICNDCHAKSVVPFNIVGSKCQTCRSYNTSRIGEEK